MEADALATAFMVMGLETSKQYLNKHPEMTHFSYTQILKENGYNTKPKV